MQTAAAFPQAYEELSSYLGDMEAHPAQPRLLAVGTQLASSLQTLWPPTSPIHPIQPAFLQACLHIFEREGVRVVYLFILFSALKHCPNLLMFAFRPKLKVPNQELNRSILSFCAYEAAMDMLSQILILIPCSI